MELINLNLDKIILKYLDCFKDLTNKERSALSSAIERVASPLLWEPILKEPTERGDV